MLQMNESSNLLVKIKYGMIELGVRVFISILNEVPSYFSFKYVIKYVIKTKINFRGQALVKPLRSAGSRALFYPISIMSQISNEVPNF